MGGGDTCEHFNGNASSTSEFRIRINSYGVHDHENHTCFCKLA